MADAVPAKRSLAVSAAPALAEWLKRRGGAPLLLGPDEESEQWVRALAEPGGFEYLVARKERLGDRDVRVTLPSREWHGRSVLLVDDVVSTGYTLAETAAALRARGAAPIRALVTHAILPGEATDRLAAAGVEELWSSDSIPHASNRVPLDALLAGALRNL